jgi:hypothetical protein
MATMPVIDELDRCKIALQYVAEMQSDSLTAVFDLLLERLEDAIGQVHAHLRQYPCPVHPQAHETPVPTPHRVLTVVPRHRQTPHSPAPVVLEDLHAGNESPCADA